MPKYIDHEYLNYPVEVDEFNLGRIMGPNNEGDSFRVEEIIPRTDGKPGSTLVLQRLLVGES